jgi:hypothetical protein
MKWDFTFTSGDPKDHGATNAQAKHVSTPRSRFSTACCSAALASPFVLALPTLTLTRHPLEPDTLLSVGRRPPFPQVTTSFGVNTGTAGYILESTKRKSAAEEQDVLLEAGKLTLR